MKKIILIFLVLSIFELNSELLFKPFLANTFEPRMGSLYQFDEEKLRLDIGYSHDFMNFNIGNNPFSVGADFFTYTRLRSEGRFKFPVETSDYFFGLNANYKTKLLSGELAFRLRISHISSHLVDGYSSDGVFNKMPFTYSREFFDLAAAWTVIDNLRLYIGVNYVFSVIPKDVGAVSPQLGFDYSYKINELIELNAGFDHKSSAIASEYSPQNSFEAGINIITSESAKINLNYFFYDGRSIHGLFYKDFENYSGIGFRVIFY